jgi:chromate transporter
VNPGGGPGLAGLAGLEALQGLQGLQGLGWADLVQLWAHFSLLSLLAVGGAITTAPDMQRYLVVEHGWLSDAQFTADIALAQAAPGPNLLFVALMGWSVAGPAGLLATMAGILGPSSIVALLVGRYRQRRGESRAMRAFTAGLMPLTLGLLLATGWLLTAPTRQRWEALALVAGTVLLSVATRLSPIWLIAGGALVGALALA